MCLVILITAIISVSLVLFVSYICEAVMANAMAGSLD